ncbi:hypothetical protein D3OALGB2SA_2885 [Olavius algarvensis associated proteobacterium Delta 3]|nr:hypothetical protein D3OALGB2SA_2885 [Olavius algarvensis associated proteobacterium Delta 3]
MFSRRIDALAVVCSFFDCHILKYFRIAWDFFHYSIIECNMPPSSRTHPAHGQVTREDNIVL